MLSSAVLTVDPSVHFTGVAVWAFASLEAGLALLSKRKTAPRPRKTFLLEAQEKDWIESANSILEQFENLLDKYEVSEVFCEQPQYMAGAHQATASGSLQKLCHVAGMFASSCARRKIKFEYVRIPDWKGNLPKKIVQERIEKLYTGKLKYKRDEWDAVGIGLYKLGLF